MKKASCCR